MSTLTLATKLYIPPPRPKVVPRPRLLERLNAGLPAGHKLTLISAPAGFGKTTLVSAWVAGCERPAAWLSLDAGDNDPTRFLAYLVAALQTISAGIGAGVLAALESPQPPPTEALLTTLINEITAIPDHPSTPLRTGFILVLDDYHLVEAKPVDQALAFLIEHLPLQMHLVIVTREDPALPLARLRVRGQLTELRAVDLRFTPAEAADFLNQVMGLNLSSDDIAALEARTEGWIAGLQLAALSMQGQRDTASFIKSFTGSHHFVLDYLVEEVLGQQPAEVQAFLLRTSILDRLCGPLCDAVMDEGRRTDDETSSFVVRPSSAILEHLERANLFIVPLDNERRWYRYHHLFAELLRQRLGQSLAPKGIAELHIHASEWYENNGLILDAFHHAAAANDIDRAARLMESKKMPIHLRSAATTILDWLKTLPETVQGARPALLWKQASLMLAIGQTAGVEEILRAAEAALEAAAVSGASPPDTTRGLIGKIAIARATLALSQFQIETILTQARRALEYLAPDDLARRSTAMLTLGLANYLQGDRDAAGRAYAEALSLAQTDGDMTNTILASLRLGQIQAHNNQLYQAAETYQQVLKLIGEYSPADAAAAYICLARIHYEWNDLDATEEYLAQSSQLAQQYIHVVDRIVLSDLYLARLKLAQGDMIGAANIVSRAERTARQENIHIRLQDLAYSQAWIHFRQGDFDAVIQTARRSDLPLMHARALIAQGHASTALEIIEPLRQEAEAKGWADRQLEVLAVRAIALHASGEKGKAIAQLGEVLALAEGGGFIRLFVDEGPLMAQLLTEAARQGIMPDYANRLLAAFGDLTKDEGRTTRVSSSVLRPSSLPEPLSQRELEILKLVAQGRSNREIGERLFLALDTVKGHNRRIFDKLQVQSRTEAIARARELGLL
jgi:LuxR family maltose regulon positive regulatory protein